MNDGRFRVSDGDTFQVESFSSQATAFRASVRVEYDDGEQAPFEVAHTPNSDRTSATAAVGSRVTRDGTVVSAVMEPAALKRGQCFARIRVLNASQNQVDELCAGYVTGSKSVRLGEFEDSLSGRGFVTKLAVADDIAPADIEHTLAVTNALRRINGFIWYYHSSGDVASRTMRASIRDLGEGLPTGMTSGGNTLTQLWPSAGVITLTSNQEGMIVVDGQFAVSQDNGTPTFEDPTSRPNPFPYWAAEGDVGEFFFDVANEEAADRHTIYIIQEEWIDV